jgi:hypothetical protein
MFGRGTAQHQVPLILHCCIYTLLFSTQSEETRLLGDKPLNNHLAEDIRSGYILGGPLYEVKPLVQWAWHIVILSPAISYGRLHTMWLQ